MIRLFCLLLVALGSASAAQDYVTVPDAPLSDEDFYRLVACGAAPGQNCTMRDVRWGPNKASDLSIGIVDMHPAYPAHKRPVIARALADAAEEINAAGTALRLRMADSDETPTIAVYLVPQKEGDTIRGLPQAALNGTEMFAANFHVWWNGNGRLTDAVILMASDIAVAEIPSIALEEVVQATGLITDIDSPYYATRSIFSETGQNDITRLQPQDLMALRRHYPPN